MKSKKLYLATALIAGSFVAADAQNVFVEETSVVVEEIPCYNQNVYFNSWRNNWFIELGGGAGLPLVERGTSGKEMGILDKSKWTAAYSFGFGHWMSPYLGWRIKATGGALHWDAPSAAVPNGWSKSKHVNLQYELMWDMFNSCHGVNPNRVFSIVPFFGLGGDANWDFKGHNAQGLPAGSNITREYSDTKMKSVQWTVPVSAGLQFRFRLAKCVDFFAEARATFYGDNWNNNARGCSVDAYVSAMGGFSFNIKGRGWNSFNDCDYAANLNELQNAINNMRVALDDKDAQINKLKNDLDNCENADVYANIGNSGSMPEGTGYRKKDCVNAPLMATVRFTINSDVIMPTEEVNVYTMAEWLKANPNEKIIIAGYADRDTGTSEYNMQLSERRAEAVKNALVNQYGIDPSRLTTKAYGSDEQEYSVNDWNRIVIFKQ